MAIRDPILHWVDRSTRLHFCGHAFDLVAERALVHTESKTVFVTDPHWGKESTFQHEGIPLPDGALEADLARLAEILRNTQATRLWILGDLIHAPIGLSPKVIQTLSKWRASVPIPISAIHGNHDPEYWPAEWHISDAGKEAFFCDIKLVHNPNDARADEPTLCGHFHPQYSARHFRRSWKLPCLYVRDKLAILPAFTHFSGKGLLPVDPHPDLYLLSPASIGMGNGNEGEQLSFSG